MQICREPDCATFAADASFLVRLFSPTKLSDCIATNAIADLRQQIHDDLRIQHPEWVLLNGECPMCDDYEARLMDLLALVSSSPYDAPPNGSASEIRSKPR
jgi:hypothetical protein